MAKILFTEFGNNKVAAKITTDGVVTELPEMANSGPDGDRHWIPRTIWFLRYASNRV